MRFKNLLALVVALFFAGCSSPAVENSDESKEDITEAQSKEAEKSTQPSLELVWETDTSLITNESVLYYPEGNSLIVSSINGQPLDKDGEGYLSIVKPEGTIEVMEWVTGLDAPKGMAASKGMLYVTNIDELVEIDIAEGVIKNRYPVSGAQFLNDVTIGNGVVYFSDMSTGKLHGLSKGEISTLAEGLKGLNGLAYNKEEGNLYMLNALGLQRMAKDGNISTVNSEITGGDGLILLEKDVYLASRWQGEIWLIQGEKATLLLDSKGDMQTADIGYIPEENLVLVPRFFSNKVSAYRLNY